MSASIWAQSKLSSLDKHIDTYQKDFISFVHLCSAVMILLKRKLNFKQKLMELCKMYEHNFIRCYLINGLPIENFENKGWLPWNLTLCLSVSQGPWSQGPIKIAQFTRLMSWRSWLVLYRLAPLDLGRSSNDILYIGPLIHTIY